jgi:hypothetical protein
VREKSLARSAGTAEVVVVVVVVVIVRLDGECTVCRRGLAMRRRRRENVVLCWNGGKREGERGWYVLHCCLVLLYERGRLGSTCRRWTVSGRKRGKRGKAERTLPLLGEGSDGLNLDEDVEGKAGNLCGAVSIPSVSTDVEGKREGRKGRRRTSTHERAGLWSPKCFE